MKILRQIRMFCLECCLGNSKEVFFCPSATCALHNYRKGLGDEKKALKAIEKKCLNCYGSNRHNTLKCAFKDCPLYALRSKK